MNVEKMNRAVALDMMIAFWDLFAELQIENDPWADEALKNYRRWETIYSTLERGI
jgi:hypothetical protein